MKVGIIKLNLPSFLALTNVDNRVKSILENETNSSVLKFNEESFFRTLIGFTKRADNSRIFMVQNTLTSVDHTRYIWNMT